MLRFAIFFSFVSFLLFSLSYYLIKKRLNLSNTGNYLLLAVLAIASILMVVGPLIYRSMKDPLENELLTSAAFFQYFFMGWMGMVILTFLGLETIQILFEQFDPKKRIFLTEGVVRGLVAGISVASVAGFFQAKHGPQIKNVSIKIKKLPTAFQNLVVTQISDVHIGPMLHRDFLENVVTEVLSTKPDIIVITGDLVDGTVEQLKHHMEPLKKLTAPHGVYFCTGNHEYYSGALEWISHLESIGIHVFKNSNTIIKRNHSSGEEHKILLAGVFDPHGEQFYPDHISDPIKAAQTTEDVGCKVLLAHNPQTTKDNARADFDLQLSGHTHAGQFYPFVFVAGIFHQYFEGLYSVNERMQVYVNRGTGYWGPPNRLGKSSEITRITLTS